MLPASHRRRVHPLTLWVLVFGLLSGITEWAVAQGAGNEDLRFDDRLGLPQNTAFHVIQDHQAFLWVGTNDGLTRYDGQAFVVFRHQRDDATSLSHNTVRRVVEDRRHRLWIRTEAGLDRYVRETNRFQHYPVEAQQMVDDDGLLVASPTGLHRYNEAADRFDLVVAFPLSGDSPSPRDAVWGLHRAQSGETWLTTQKGRLFGISRGGVTSRLQMPWQKAAILNEDPGGRLWIGHEDGMGVIDPAGPAVVLHAAFDAVRGPVIALGRGSGDRLWFGGARFYSTDLQGRAVVPVDMGDEPLVTPIHSILHDREGLLWLATPRGLRFHNPYAKRWIHLGTSATRPVATVGTAVMALARGPGNQLWIGSLDRGASGVSTKSVCPDQVWALLRDAQDRVWVGSSHGLCAMESGRARKVPLAPRRTVEPTVFTLRQDHAGGIWVGTTVGLFRMDPGSLVIRRHDAVSDGNVEGLLVAGDGQIWVSTSRSELYRIDPATFDTERYALGGSTEFRGSEGFWAIAEVGDGRLWLGSDRGLFLFDPSSQALDAIDERRGVPVAPVYAILQDEQRRLWLSTRNGLLRHDNPLAPVAGTAQVRLYTTEDGLPFAEFNRRAAMTGSDGSLMFGGMGGAVSFLPREFRDNPYPPLVHVLGVERSRADGPPEHASPVDHLVTLAVGDTGLVIHFTAPTFANAHRLQLQYRMDRVDPDWVTASDDRRARYPALRPGRYAFRVRAANADGVWNLDGAAITIIAPTPWWASWWFRGSSGLAGVIALVAALRWILTRPLRRRVRALEMDQRVRAERERISRDLHDHVGAQMTTLLAGIELAGLRAERGEQGSLQNVLSDLGDETRRTIAQLRETVWSLRQEHISLRDLAAQVQEDLRNRQRVLARPRLTCETAGDLTIEIGSQKALHLFRIVQESITNAIRHANASTVHVEIASHPETGVRVTVRDDGTFQRAADHDGTGLASMQSRANDIGAGFICHGTAQGTTIEVVLPSGA